MSDYKRGDFSKAQNKHDEFLEKEYPNVPLSLMRDIYEIHKNFSEEQQEDFMTATTNKNWSEYDKKYNLGAAELQYETYDNICEDMEKKQEELDLELKNKEKNEIEEIDVN